MAEKNVDFIHDPYRRCEEICTHDLARGVSIAELLGSDGPFPDSHPLLSFRPVGLFRRPASDLPLAASS